MKLTYLVVAISLTGPLLGAIIGAYGKYTKDQIYKMLVFAAGVMIAISLIQLIPSSLDEGGPLLVFIGFAAGCFLMWVLNLILPHYHHSDQKSKLRRVAVFLFVGIFIHNFPEGLAIGFGGIKDVNFSLLVALAITIHDIPETVCISAPLCKTLKNRQKSFWLAVLSAFPTIIGFLVSYFLFQELPSQYFSLLISMTAGIMVYISAFEIIRPICGECMKKSVIGTYLLLGVLFVIFLGFI